MSSIEAGLYIDTDHHCDMERYIVSDFGYNKIVIWVRSCLFLVLKAAFTIKLYHFLNSSDCSTCSNTCFSSLSLFVGTVITI